MFLDGALPWMGLRRPSTSPSCPSFLVSSQSQEPSTWRLSYQ
uniref:Uncharacterized protein n=1 Tax=Arundo donax TaxID=35708 RepID=A0A0A8Z869_ARUDO